MSVANELEPIELGRDDRNRKQWGCPYEGCTTVRNSKSKVRMHMNTHTGHKPFKCPEPGCSYKAAVSGYLSEHCKTRHGYLLRDRRPDPPVAKFRNLGPSSAALKFNDGHLNPEHANMPQLSSISFVETVLYDPPQLEGTYEEPENNDAHSECATVITKSDSKSDLVHELEGSQRLPSVLGYSGVLYDPAHPRLPPISSWYRDDQEKHALFTKHPPHLGLLSD